MNARGVVARLPLIAILLTSGPAEQSSVADKPAGLSYLPPKGYVCYRASQPLKIDGRLDDVAWQAVPWTDLFVDIEGDAKPRPRFATRVKMLWDDQYFY